MIDLQKTSGLPIELTDDLHLNFNHPMEEFPMTFARKFSEMTPVLLNASAKSDRDETYFVYRGLCLPEHKTLIQGLHLTYDITIVPPMMLGNEFNKTVGHYHSNIEGGNLAHPELYQVLNGHALFLIQKMDPNFQYLISFYAIEAHAGDKIIYPPNYGHVMVNIGDEPLVTANWLSSDYKPLYEPIAQHRGMGYYVVKGNEKLYEFVANPSYQNHPGAKMKDIQSVVYKHFDFSLEVPMYVSGVKNPASLEFLRQPQKYALKLSTLTS